MFTSTCSKFSDSLSTALCTAGDILWGWPLTLGIISICVWLTFVLRGIQIRYFFDAFKLVLWPGKHATSSEYLTPFQAFINTLSASIGNGSAAGMATAMFHGGPGTAFWIFIFGFFAMALRFAEVYVSTRYIEKSADGSYRGGPMVFLERVPGGHLLPGLYAAFTVFVAFAAGSAMQCNSISTSVQRLIGTDTQTVAIILVCFVIYLMVGGAQRIIAISSFVIPIKVGLFFMATGIVLFYHAEALWPAIQLIVQEAFTPQAMTGAMMGSSIAIMWRYGLSRAVSATEVGLGTAGVLYGATRQPKPFDSGVMSMASIVVSNHLVCCVLMLIFVATGVWNSGLTGTAMTCAAYETVFGVFGSVIVTTLTTFFGIGVLVVYAYIGRECWIYLTRGRFVWLYTTIFILAAGVGSVTRIETVWSAVDIGNAGMLILSVYGVLYAIPRLRKEILARSL